MSALDVAIGLFRRLSPLLADRVLGASRPGAQQRPQEKGARRHALDALRAYLTEVDVALPGQPGTFRVPAERIHAEWPAEGTIPKLPAVGPVGFAPAKREPPWLGGPQLLDDTLDRFALCSALAWVGAHAERVNLEVWCRNVPERDAVDKAFTDAFRASELRGSLLLPMPDYFDRVARFTLIESTTIDEPEAVATARRRLLLAVDLWAPEVVLVDAGTLRPVVRASTLSAAEARDLDCR